MSMIPQSQNVDYDSLWKKSLVRVTDELSLIHISQEAKRVTSFARELVTQRVVSQK